MEKTWVYFINGEIVQSGLFCDVRSKYIDDFVYNVVQFLKDKLVEKLVVFRKEKTVSVFIFKRLTDGRIMSDQWCFNKHNECFFEIPLEKLLISLSKFEKTGN